ncbi:MAG: MmgE/PrpD family protein [Chloroflexi bacterium]|nr:MmgE/PrpD family protein [Chloroflexota bacterium]
MDETKRLVEFAHDLRFEDLPKEVAERAKDVVLDQLGVQVGCAQLQWAKAVYETEREQSGKPEATVVFYGDRLPATEAAFVNGTFGHSFELDDGHPRGHGHPGAYAVPAALAMAERQGASGKDFLTAVVIAYEIALRAGWAVTPYMFDNKGPHYSSACGPFGVAAAAAKLLGLKAHQMLHAVGIAEQFAGGLEEYSQSSGSCKRIISAVAAAAGIRSALFAQRGVTGPVAPLEGIKGLRVLAAGQIRPERLTERLGQEWFIMDNLFKPYASCGGIHAAIDATKILIREYRVTPEDVEEITVGVTAGISSHVGTIVEPKDVTGSQFSTSFSLALTFYRGGNTVGDYTEEAIRDPKLLAFARRVRVETDPWSEENREEHIPAVVTLKTMNGQVYQQRVLDAKGTSGNPMSRQELHDKFRMLFSLNLPKERAEQVIAQVNRLEQLDNLAPLVALLKR